LIDESVRRILTIKFKRGLFENPYCEIEKLEGTLLDAAQLGYYNEDMEFVVEPGKLDIMLGTSSEELPLQAQVSLVGEKKNLLQKRVYTCPVEVR
jgi:beta-glucosidase